MKKNRAKSYGRNATNRNIASAESQESFMRIPPPLVVLLAIAQTQDVADGAIGIVISRTYRSVRRSSGRGSRRGHLRRPLR